MNPQFSLFKSCRDKQPECGITLTEFADRIVNPSAEVKARVATVRRLLAEGDKDGAGQAKQELPAVTLSGTFYKRQAAALEDHSGLATIDLDHLNETALATTRATLQADAHVALVFVSPSGAGIKGAIRVSPAADDAGHKRAFAACEAYLRETYGLTIDPCGKDVSRLCFVSHDPFCFSREDARELDVDHWAPDPAPLTATPPPAPNAAPAGQPDDDVEEIPDDVFPVPGGEVTYLPCAETIFPKVATSARWFMRGGDPHDVTHDEHGATLRPLTPERAVSELESIAQGVGARVARRETQKAGKDGDASRVVWRTVPMPTNSMKVLLQTSAAADHLPTIKQVTASPVLIPSDDGTKVELVESGYHPHGGGVYVSSNFTVQDVPLSTAVAALMEIHADTAFCTDSDRARGIAFAISPALRAGGWIKDDFPLHIAEATESQSGKDYLQKLHCAIYGETASVIAPKEKAGGVGSVDETLSRALISGKPFVCLSNFRGKIESGLLETAIRGQGRVEARALRIAATVDCSPFNWQLSTNGAEFTRDLANRAIITRIRKNPPSYKWREYPEGDLLAHVKANRGFYLGCVHAVILEWARHGRPGTTESRHDFRGWCRALDWITRNVFKLPPLLDGHQEEQARVGNPALQWLRAVAVAVVSQGRGGEELTATNLGDLCEEEELGLPGRAGCKDAPHMQIGRAMGKLFKEASPLLVDSVTVSRHAKWDSERGREAYRYSFSETKPAA